MRHVTLRDTVIGLREQAVLTSKERAARSPRQTGVLTQEEAARRVGTKRETWNKWESGKRRLSPYYARVIEQRFDLPTGALAPHLANQRDATPDEVAHLEARVRRLERALGSRLDRVDEEVANS